MSINGAFFKKKGNFESNSDLKLSYYSDKFLLKDSMKLLISFLTTLRKFLKMQDLNHRLIQSLLPQMMITMNSLITVTAKSSKSLQMK